MLFIVGHSPERFGNHDFSQKTKDTEATPSPDQNTIFLSAGRRK